jgi:hypothetical protein
MIAAGKTAADMVKGAAMRQSVVDSRKDKVTSESGDLQVPIR